MNEAIKSLELGGRRIVLIGTAHVSQESINDVRAIIASEQPDRVCIELDEARHRSMTNAQAWEKTDIVKVIKEGKAFLLLANLALSSFQRKMGMDSGIKPGAEMLAALEAAESAGIPCSLCDRDVQITLRRAWAKSNFWNKNKLLAQLIAGALSSEKPSQEEIEAMKNQSELDAMMAELADYLPAVKEVLIDERDQYLAAKIWEAPGNTLVAVVGAGHAAGIEAWLRRFASGTPSDVQALELIPPKKTLAKAAGLVVPLTIVGLIIAGFFTSGAEKSLELVLRWVLLNGSLAALGSLVCLAHPLTILVSFVTAPIGTLNVFLAVGMFAALAEASLRRPSVLDFQRLATDITSIKGFYRNRVTHILLIFFFSSLGGAIGNFISIPALAFGL